MLMATKQRRGWIAVRRHVPVYLLAAILGVMGMVQGCGFDAIGPGAANHGSKTVTDSARKGADQAKKTASKGKRMAVTAGKRAKDAAGTADSKMKHTGNQVKRSVSGSRNTGSTKKTDKSPGSKSGDKGGEKSGGGSSGSRAGARNAIGNHHRMKKATHH